MKEVLNTPRPAFMTDELVMFQDAVDKFIERECVPHLEKWREQGRVPQETWDKAAQAGLLMISAPAEYGGGGGHFGHEAVLNYRLSRYGALEFLIAVQNLMFGPYLLKFGTEAQKRRYIPKLASAEYIAAIAMTEPDGGSDLASIRTTAIRDGDSYVINGRKTFITQGQYANLIMLACKTDRDAGSRGFSLFFIETDGLKGFTRGRHLDKIGLKAQGTAELSFEDVRVPASALVGGEEGQGFRQIMVNMTQERVIVAVEAIAMIERALQETLVYTTDRKAFGKAIREFQNTQFILADIKTEATAGKIFVESCIERHIRGELDPVTAAMAKLWMTETQSKVVDRCLQMFGGYGYINEYPIAHMWQDARVSRIYGGTSEIMKLIIGRSL